jgi:nucleoid-associated protein YgaU
MSSKRHNDSNHPHFSAFAVMILVLLLIFAFISKINILLEDTEKLNTTISKYSPVKSKIIKSVNRVKTTFTNSDNKVLVKVNNAVRTISTEKAVAREDSAVVDSDQQETDNKQKQYSIRESGHSAYPIVPSRPKKGDKLGAKFAALNDYVPAEKKFVKPEYKPERKIEYKAAPSPERLKIVKIKYHIHTLKKNETLWKISFRYLGDGRLWQSISDANPGLNPKNLKPGSKIRIPYKNSNSDINLSMVY